MNYKKDLNKKTKMMKNRQISAFKQYKYHIKTVINNI